MPTSQKLDNLSKSYENYADELSRKVLAQKETLTSAEIASWNLKIQQTYSQANALTAVAITTELDSALDNTSGIDDSITTLIAAINRVNQINDTLDAVNALLNLATAITSADVNNIPSRIAEVYSAINNLP